MSIENPLLDNPYSPATEPPRSVDDSSTISDRRAPGNDLAQSKYDFRYKVFPSDLGRDDVGHYMVININVPTQGLKTNGLQLRTPAGAFTNYFTPIDNVSKVDTLRFGNNNLPGADRGLLGLIPRQTRRIAESIALHMPTPLMFSDQNVYQEVSLTALAGEGLAGVGSYLKNLAGNIGEALNAVRGSSGGVFDGLGNAVDIGFKLAQNPINPAIEVLFSNKIQRQFAFELLMAPRNEKESESIKQIIATLRFHASPEINTGLAGIGGLTWIPPAEFDITFFNKGVENFNILRMNTCVLERIEVDYSPTGVYSTFRNGHPVAVRVGLAFRELEPIHKKRVLQGF